jgi:D-methionine transport system ATP-binding protein
LLKKGDVAMIEIKDLSKAFDKNYVLNNVSLHIPKGSIFGLVGRSGAGKSTLLRCINGLEQFESGNLIVDGIAVQNLNNNDIRQFRKEIGFIFQNFSLLERLSVYENIALPMRCWKYKNKDIDKIVKNLLEMVDIPEKLHSYPRELSGGQKQRVAIARALTMNPKILLCDEATSALDPKSAQSVTALLNRINKELGITIVVVTHQMSVLRDCCEQIAILENGNLQVSGKVKDIFLEQPPSLVNLIGEKYIPLDKEGVNLKLVYVNEESGQYILTKMARELDVDFSINGGEIDKYRNGVMGTIHISFPKHNFDVISQYLDKHKIKYQLIELEDNISDGKERS